MCGIVGYIGKRQAQGVLVEGLSKLEYRGYDSAGIAVSNAGKTKLVRAQGKLGVLADRVAKKQLKGVVGIGHTRWATHGKPSETNAHPHAAGRVVLVHNGIIENYAQLKKKLPKKGRELSSETDTEVVAHLINFYFTKTKSFLTAFKKALGDIDGTYAFVAYDTQKADTLYIAKKGSPLVVGLGKKETFVASDIPALLGYTRDVVFLENHEVGVVTPDKVEFYNQAGKRLKKKPRRITWTAAMAEKGGYKHFMLKEIMEQPQALTDTLMGRLVKKNQIQLACLEKLFKSKKNPFNRYYIVACGTSWHAGMAGKYFIEAISKIPVSVDTASEFRYREPFIDNKTLLIVISQSGETADTLACVEEAQKSGAKIVAICNVVDSSIARKADCALYTQAGPEIGVASTKAFTTQLVVLLLMAFYFGRHHGQISSVYIKRAIAALESLPKLAAQVIKQTAPQLLKIAEKYHPARDIYYIARGVHYPIALEGALKLKEISYIHAEGYSAGEMKHGPIALIEPGTPVVALAPKDRVCEKMISNIEEVKARGASVIVLCTKGDKRFNALADAVIPLPKTEWYITPVLASLPLQLLAYHIADIKGCDVDQPRNLAKSVTVE